MKKLILFNGPPRSGKDTAAEYVWAKLDNAMLFKLSAPIKSAIKSMFDLTDAEVLHLEANKGTSDPLLFDRSYRNVQISFSEQWAKEQFGTQVFGKLAARKLMKARSQVFICSDSGFDYEAAPLINHVGTANTLLVRIHRPGYDFTGDSRSYITFARRDLVELDLLNNTTKADFYERLDKVIGAWMES